ncbi:hypothetical protein JW868_02105 [Candidatus Woesearchaeota archaeon]|nr:hypothetical protein [Candidatus Woesearchaeota archaeon]
MSEETPVAGLEMGLTIKTLMDKDGQGSLYITLPRIFGWDYETGSLSPSLDLQIELAIQHTFGILRGIMDFYGSRINPERVPELVSGLEVYVRGLGEHNDYDARVKRIVTDLLHPIAGLSGIASFKPMIPSESDEKGALVEIVIKACAPYHEGRPGLQPLYDPQEQGLPATEPNLMHG